MSAKTTSMGLLEDLPDFWIKDETPVVIEMPDGTRYHIGKIDNAVMRGEDVIVLYGVGKGVTP